MAYTILIIGAVYAVFWLLSFLFSLKTKGQRSVLIPLAMVLLFGSVAAAGVFFLEQAPKEYLTTDKYMALTKGMSKEEVHAALGSEKILQHSALKNNLADESKQKIFDLSANNIQMPPEVKGRLPPGIFNAERVDSKIKITIEGEGSPIYTNENRPTADASKGERVDYVRLGFPASGNRTGINGLKGLSLRFFVPDLEDEKAQMEARAQAKKDFLAAKQAAQNELNRINQVEVDHRLAWEEKQKGKKKKKVFNKEKNGYKWSKEELEQNKATIAKTEESWIPTPLYVKAKDGMEWFVTEGVDWNYNGVKLDAEGNEVKEKIKMQPKDKDGKPIKDAEEVEVEVPVYLDEDEAAEALCIAMNFNNDSNGRCKPAAEGAQASDNTKSKKAPEQALSDAQLAAFPFIVSRDIDQDPAQLIMTVAHKKYLGKHGNDLRVQAFHYVGSTVKEDGQPLPKKLDIKAEDLKTSKNKVVKIGRFIDGESHNMRQGAHSASLEFWYEEDPILDEDFNSQPRMIVAGYVSEKLVCVGQLGLDLGGKPEPLPYVFEPKTAK